MAIIDDDKLAGISDALLPWLRQRLGDALLELPPAGKPAEGGSSETVFLAPVLVEGDGRRQHHWVLRIQATGHQIYEDPAVERQFAVMRELAGTAVPVPKMLWYEADPAVLGAPFFLMERVAGAVPAALYHRDGLFVQASVAERRQLWASGVRALAALHCVDPARFDFLARPGARLAGLDQELARWGDYQGWCGVAPHAIQLRARDWLAQRLPAERPTGLAWGDARLSNMVFDNGECRAVIDWETASLGGAETDLGWWLFYDWYVTEGMGIAPLPGLGDRAEFIAIWESCAGRLAQALAWHEVFATWRYSMISRRARLLRGIADPAPEQHPVLRRLAALTGQ